MVALPPALSIPAFSASATVNRGGKFQWQHDKEQGEHTLGNMAIHRVDNDSDFGSRHVNRLITVIGV
jgi:hypothetical protein